MTLPTENLLQPQPEELDIGAATSHITKALAAFIHHHPFFAELMASLGELVITESVPTAATDGYRIMVNPVWANDLSHAQLVFVLAHEVMHIVFHHCPRFKSYMDRGYITDDVELNPRKANIAADAIINSTLVADGVGEMPAEGILHEDITPEHSFEQAYRLLVQEDEDGDGGGNGGDGFDDHIAPSGQPGAEPKPESAIERALVMAEQSAKLQGKLPGNIERLIGKLLRPSLDWPELLKQYLNRIVAGRGTRTWKSPNRRRFVMLNEYTPRSVGQRLDKIVFCTDLSGSIGEQELNAFCGEIRGVMDDVPFTKAWCMWFDAHVQRVDEFEYVEDFITMLSSDPPPGGGGTDFRPCFEWVEKELDEDIDVMIFITDGYGPSPDSPPPYPVIVLTTDEDLPFGDNINLEV